MKLERRVVLIVLCITLLLNQSVIPATNGQENSLEGIEWHKPIHFVGAQPTLVLLVEFSDVRLKLSASKAEAIVKTADEFFRKSSYGKFWLEYYIHPRKITLPKPLKHYGAPEPGHQRGDSAKGLSDFYVTVFSTVREREKIDLTKFKHVIIIHAGGNEGISGNPDDIWYHCFFSLGVYLFTEKLGTVEKALELSKKMWPQWYPITEQLVISKPDGSYHLLAGVEAVSEDTPPFGIIHEFTHSIWAHDQYVYDEDGYSYGSEAGVWTNMDIGSFLKPTVDIDGWTKYKLGWVDVVKVTKSGEYVIHTLDKADEPKALIIPINDREYYFIHARRPVGQDAALPAPGVLLFRINPYVYTNVINKDYWIRLHDAHPQRPTFCTESERYSWNVRMCEGFDAVAYESSGYRNKWKIVLHDDRVVDELDIELVSPEFVTEEGYRIKVLEFDREKGTARISVDLTGFPSDRTVTVTRTVFGTVVQTVYTTATVFGEAMRTVVVTVTTAPHPRQTNIENYVSIVIVLAALAVAFAGIVLRRSRPYPPPPPPSPTPYP
ncbi:MAG: immune inhibitor A [Candidatus Caldarchaeum sp.]|nr:immune inhibitor A [Candidatus Caldarchaeum sp.]